MEDAGIIEIDELNDLEVTAGYSDHTLGIKACELAVARGARIIEKHFTKCKNQSSFRDHQLSADPDDLKNMIHAIPIVEKFLGNKTQGLRKSEEKNYNSVRRIPTALKKIRAGEKLTSENIGWMRSSNGESITLKHLNADLLGTKLRSPKNPGEIIESKDSFLEYLFFMQLFSVKNFVIKVILRTIYSKKVFCSVKKPFLWSSNILIDENSSIHIGDLCIIRNMIEIRSLKSSCVSLGRNVESTTSLDYFRPMSQSYQSVTIPESDLVLL